MCYIPGENVTFKTTRTLGKTQECEYVPGKSKLHLVWPRNRREIKIVFRLNSLMVKINLDAQLLQLENKSGCPIIKSQAWDIRHHPTRF